MPQLQSRRLRVRRNLGGILAASIAAVAVPLVSPIQLLGAAPVSAAESTQCPANPVWGGIETLTGRDANVSLYSGGNLTISGRTSETEGLTVVVGDVDATGIAGGFSFGQVGMGSGQWPYPDADALAVGGNTRTDPGQTPPFVFSGSDFMDVPANGRVGGVAEGPEFRRGLNAAAPIQYGLGDAALQAVYPGNGGAPVDYTQFNERVDALSTELMSVPATGSTVIGDAPDGDITSTWYPGEVVSTVHVENEAMVTFTGDGTSSLQVFNLDGEALTQYAQSKSGVSFAFEGIPAGASVAVNVTGTDISFRQGWRTLFNGVDVHDPFATPTEFATASAAVLFNYGEANSLTIAGGTGTETSRVDVNGDTVPGIGPFQDEAAAQSLGSIISPNADVTLNVSTNGRLLTGGDVSLIAIDTQLGLAIEHHAFPWSGSRTTSCQGVGSVVWSKVDGVSSDLLAGSVWRLTGPDGFDEVVADNGDL
ncbi:choice-of-anchor A family protein, partial [Pseudoclavibacter endophyticus]